MAGNMWGNGYAAPQQQSGGVMTAFINNEASATTYPVGAGTTVNLVDINNGKMYLKSTDPNGMPCPIRVFEIREVTPQAQNADSVSRQEFNELTQQLQNLQQLILKQQAPAVPAEKVAGGSVK